MTMTKLEQYLKAHGYNIAAVARAVGLKSRGDFRNRMVGRLNDFGKPFQFTGDQKRKLVEFLGATEQELF